MAQQYTQIGITDIKRFIERGFRALKPKHSVVKGEQVFDLFLSPKAGVRIWSSIPAGMEVAADVGVDAIRVQFYNFGLQRPLVPGKAPIVKRTQNWRDNLQERVEEYIELYDDKEEYWESRTG